ncbi:tape measure protein [Yokenella regensburgei]|uniref:tape measure protein n=1 Tax=Yokenella regensburgei TaxID=158877 RepID=UPI0013756A95|nr:tape measure protein [Yokenella regensburgei]KAF1367475.1 tape measure domain-containing protein [Yokenella regensburgei]
MSEQTQDLVTKLDVIPDLSGLDSFDAAIERAIAKVNQLDAAIKRVNNLKPASPYAPASTASTPSVATTAAVATIAATGANLVSRTPLADTVRKEAQKVARAAVEGTGNGIAGLLPPPGRQISGGGGGLMLPPPGGRGGNNWSSGRAGGLTTQSTTDFNEMFHRADSRRSFGFQSDWNKELGRYDAERKPKTKKTPVAEGVEKASDSSFFSLDKLAASAATVWGGKEIFSSLADSLDSIQRQQAQIARLAQTTGDAKDAFFALNAAASEVKSDSGAFISTYTNMATATEKLGLSQEETIKATQGLVGALQLGGAETHTINDALYQMGQAFSSDRFGGDEFRSFMEAIGTMAPKVAEAFGTDVKGLREMSQAGKLTSEVMIKAFQKMAATNLDLLKKQGWTWGQVTTVMKNDWQAFLAQATIGGEWQKLTDWMANILIPWARKAEKEVAEFWSTLADESKSAILIGILGAVASALALVAGALLAAIWPFLAVGAAVWLVYEAFVEWKAWLNGEGGTIFDGLFGSFDEFERRYPGIVSLLRSISNAVTDATTNLNKSGLELLKPQNENQVMDLVTGKESSGGTLDVINRIIELFNEGNDAPNWYERQQSKLAAGSINNSGNTNTVINVNSGKEAADAVNGMNNPGSIGGDIHGNIAEATGAR